MATVSRFDAIIMDLNMPVMSGFEATAKIKEYYKGMVMLPNESGISYSPYIVALSASEFDSDLVR